MELWMFVGALAAVYLLPGPDMILVLQTGTLQGRSQAFATVAGLAMARGLHVALAALGLATLFKTAPWTFDAVRYLGAAYLVWMGVQLLFSGAGRPGESTQGAPGPAASHRRAWRRGLLTNLLNPKSLLFCSVLLPQFVLPGEGTILLQFALLGVLLVGIGVLFDSLYATAGSWLRRWLADGSTRERLQRWSFGSLLIGFGIRLALYRQP
ncbi:LysE family translocator [Halomonas sp. C05BenzN]|uniref:LysE family translocator n=1 Tax=Halomonas sp. C05BenzN TaxID=3411041 RepID=UPI003B95201F